MARAAVLNQIGNAGTHFIVLSLFWVILYEKLVFGLARSALKDQVDQVVQNAATQIDQKAPLVGLVRAYNTKDDGDDLSSASIDTNRRQIKKILLIVAGVATGLWVMHRNFKGMIQWSRIFKENLVLFAGVGVIEYWFFTRVAQHYAPILPSDILRITKQRVLDYGHC